jgi:hypothetical protein
MRQPIMIRRPSGSIGFQRRPPEVDYPLSDTRDRELDHPREFWRGVGWGIALSVPLWIFIAVTVWGFWIWAL